MAILKKKILKWILLSILVIGTTGGIVAYKMWTKPHRNVEEAAALSVAATKLATEYENNEPQANSDYLDKVLEVTGEISKISKNQKGEPVITLKGTDMGGIICTLESAMPATTKTGATVVVRGICTGYLSDVVLVRCVLKTK
jgi:tRNA_anti-like